MVGNGGPMVGSGGPIVGNLGQMARNEIPMVENEEAAGGEGVTMAGDGVLPVGSEDALLNDVVEMIEKDELKSRIEKLEFQLKEMDECSKAHTAEMEARIKELEAKLMDKSDECLNLSKQVEEFKDAMSAKEEEVRNWRLKVRDLKSAQFKNSKPFDSETPLLAEVEDEQPTVSAESTDIRMDEDQLLESLEAKYPDKDHLQVVRNLPKRGTPVFRVVENYVKPTENVALMRLLHQAADPEKLIQLMQVDDAAYVSLTGQKPGIGANVSAKTDSMDELSLLAKSTSWMSQLRGAYNKIARFAETNREYLLFDRVKAKQSDVDFVLSYFLVWLTSIENGRALGTRFTPDSLKQLKTGIKNVLTSFLKRGESFDQDHFPFFHSTYVAK